MALKRTLEESAPLYIRNVRYARVHLDDIDLIIDTLNSPSEEWAVARQERHNADFTKLSEEEEKDFARLYAKIFKTRSRRVTLRAGNALADTSDDLRQATTHELRRVKIVSRSSDVVCELRRRNARVYTYDTSDPTTLQIVDSIASHLNGHKSVLGCLSALSRFFYLLLLLTLGLGVYMVLTTGSVYPISKTASFLIFALPIYALMLDIFVIYRLGSAQVLAKTNSEARGLSEESRRNVYIAVTGAAVGALTAFIATLLIP